MNPLESLAHAYSEELPWLAFLYVSEELTPDEVVDFEERLLTDQAAREAVADAMKLADGVWLASAMDSYHAHCQPRAKAPVVGSHQSEGRRSNRGVLWMATTALLAVVAFGGGWWFAGQGEFSNPIADQTDSKPGLISDGDQSPSVEGAEELVGLWSESRDLLAALGPMPEYPSESSEEFHSQDGEESEEEAFSWMLAAVSATTGEAPQVNPEVMEN